MPRSGTLVRRFAVRAGLTLVGSAIASSVLSAQVRATLDLGAAGTAGARTSSPVLFQGTLSWYNRHLALEASALSSPASPSPGGLYGVMSGALRSDPLWRGWTLGLDARAGRGRRPTLFRETRTDLEAGPVFRHPDWEISSRYGVTQFEDFDRRLVRRAELFVKREFRAGYLAVGARRVTFPDTFSTRVDTTYVIAGFPFNSSRTVFAFRDRAYIDGEAEIARMIGPALVQLRGGTRLKRTVESVRPWGSLQLTAPIGRGVALVAATGWTPSYPEQRRPQSWFASAGFRLLDVGAFLRGRTPVTRSTLTLVRTGDGLRMLRVMGVEGARVELSGDFTNWEPVDMTRSAPGRWERAIVIAPGTHRLMMRVDGGEWQPPPGLPVMPDEYGGTVGVLVVD